MGIFCKNNTYRLNSQNAVRQSFTTLPHSCLFRIT